MPMFSLYLTDAEMQDLYEFSQERKQKMNVIIVLALNEYFKTKRLENAKKINK